MTDQSPHSTNTGLVYEDSLPISWQVLTQESDPAHSFSIQEANEDLLRMLSTLEDHPHEITDEHPDVLHELRRLDFKLNVLVDLVGQVLLSHVSLPKRVAVQLSPTSLSWETDTAPALGSLLGVELYISLKLPKPLVLSGRVTQVQAASGKQRVTVDLQGLGEAVEDGLQRLIFVHHRRQVAQTRRRTPRSQG